MLLVTVVWILFQYFEPTHSVPENLIEHYTSIDRSTSYPFLQNIKFGTANTCFNGYIISYPFRSTSESQGPSIGKKHGLTVSINCELAYWTIVKIHAFVSSFSLFSESNEDQNSDTNQEFKKRFETYLKYVDTIVEEYAFLIYTILDYNTLELSVHNNTYALKQLYTILIKSYYIRSSIENKDITQQISLSKILRLMLADIFELKSFFLMNCERMPVTNENLQFLYGNWKSFNVENNVIKTIDDSSIQCLNNIKSTLQLQNNVSQNICKAFNALVVINVSKIKNLFEEIADVKIRATDSKFVLIRNNMMNDITKHYDIYTIYWYHESILIAIMKLIVRDLIYLLKTKQNKRTIRSKISNLNACRTITQNPDTPSYIREGFIVLCDSIKPNYKINANLEDYFHILNGEEFESIFIKVLLPETTVQINDENRINRVVMFIRFITEISKHFKCFKYFFIPVQHDYNKYYIPFANNKAFLVLKSDTKELENACSLLTSIFALCFQTLTLLDQYNKKNENENKISEEKDVSSSELDKIVYKIKYYFLCITQYKNGENDMDILIMSYKISAILVNCSLDSNDETFQFEIRRVLNLVMNEMNKYRIKNCNLKDFNFLSLNNTYDNNVQNANVLNKPINLYFDQHVSYTAFTSGELIFDKRIIEEYSQIFNVNHIHNNIVKNTSFCTSYYSKQIKINWNGKFQELQTIFNNESIATFNPLTVYGLYKVFFYFSAAAVFYRTKEILLTKNLKIIQTNLFSMFQKLKGFGSFQSIVPGRIKDIFVEIEMIHQCFKKFSYRMHCIKSKVINIEEKFAESNIIFLDPTQVGMQQIDFEKNVDNLNDNLKIIYNKYYLNITKYRPLVPYNIHGFL